MRSIMAIAMIALRGAIRSRVMIILMLLLLLAIIGLPLTIKGDGTLTGDVRILLNYTLTFVRVILSIATVWVGCAAVSREVDEKQIQMTVTKPVHPWKIWFGKWIGILMLNIILVAFSGAIVYALLMWNTRPAVLTEEESERLRLDVLVGRTSMLPLEPEGLQREIEAVINESREAGRVPEGVPDRELRAAARNALLYRRQTVPPGATMSWTFISPGLPADKPVTLDYVAASSVLGGGRFQGRWRFLDAEGRHLAEKEIALVPDARQTLSLPSSAVPSSGPFTLEYTNLERDVTVIFAPDDSIEILGHAGSFEDSFIKTLIIIIAHLSFLAAVGVSMGTMFSLPVAAFTSVFVTILSFMDRYISNMAEQTVYFPPPTEAKYLEGLITAINYFVAGVFRVMDVLVRPLHGPNPLEQLASGRYISWTFTGSVLLFRVLLYGFLLALLGVAALRRRELALPSR